jgi:hypothetical protein
MKGKNAAGVQGRKTKARQKEILEGGGRHDDSLAGEEPVPNAGEIEEMSEPERRTRLDGKPGRQSEFPVSRGGMNQESRQHNKH